MMLGSAQTCAGAVAVAAVHAVPAGVVAQAAEQAVRAGDVAVACEHWRQAVLTGSALTYVDVADVHAWQAVDLIDAPCHELHVLHGQQHILA